MDYSDLPPPGTKGEDTEELADEQASKKKQQLLDNFVEKFGADYPNLAAAIATGADVATPSTPREVGLLALGGAAAPGMRQLGRVGDDTLMTSLNNIKNDLKVFQPGGGKVHELYNLRAIVEGNLDLMKSGKARDPKDIQAIIDRAYKFMGNN